MDKRAGSKKRMGSNFSRVREEVDNTTNIVSTAEQDNVSEKKKLSHNLGLWGGIIAHLIVFFVIAGVLVSWLISIGWNVGLIIVAAIIVGIIGVVIARITSGGDWTHFGF